MGTSSTPPSSSMIPLCSDDGEAMSREEQEEEDAPVPPVKLALVSAAPEVSSSEVALVDGVP